MTSLERIMASLSGGDLDRRAVSLTLSLYGARLSGAEPASYYRDPALYLAGQRAASERFDADIVFAPFALSLEAEAYGAALSWPPKSPPLLGRPLPSPEALRGLEPKAGGAPGLDYLLDAVALLAGHFGSERPVAAILTAPIDLPALLLGLDAWLDLLLFQEELAAELLDFSIAHFAGMAKAALARGAAFVASPVMLANPRLMGRELATRKTIPALRRAFEAAGAPVVFHHGANPIGKCLDLFADLPGVAAFVIDQRDDFALARRVLGPERLLFGGFSGPLMEKLDPGTMRKIARRALAAFGGDPRAVLASTAADIPWDTPPLVIEAVTEEARLAGPPAGVVRAGPAA